MKKVSTVGLVVVVAVIIVFVIFQNTDPGSDAHDDKTKYRYVNSGQPTEYALAKTSTANSEVKLFTGRYESNLLRVMSWLPERWDLIAVLKWSAYGNDINVLGPVASRTVPAVGIMSNKDAAALAAYSPKRILRIGPTNYVKAKSAALKGLNIQEFIGTQKELDVVTRVAKEGKATVDASIYLFKHYGVPWGFEFETSAELQNLIDSINPELISVRDIFTHLVAGPEDTEVSVNNRIQRFLKVACPVAVELAKNLGPDEPPINVHWGASSELYRLLDLEAGKLEFTPDLRSYMDVCLSHPKVNFGIRVGTSTYSNVYGIPGLQNVLEWKSKIAEVYRSDDSYIAVVNVGTENGYPRFFQNKGNWGNVSIGSKLYPLAAPPQKQKIEVNVGEELDEAILVGTEVCLLCDKLSFDNYYEWAAVDAYNVSMCVTGAASRFSYATSFAYDEFFPSCKGDVVPGR